MVRPTPTAFTRPLTSLGSLTRAFTTRQSHIHGPPKAFTRADIEDIRDGLPPAPRLTLKSLPLHDPSLFAASRTARVPREAAVLIPFCNINGEAHVLMEIRAAGLRVHASEASFPGGKAEEDDADLVVSALRETHEELGLSMSQVEVLGGLDPEYSLGNKSRVWPVVGFVHGTDKLASIRGKGPLPDLPLSSLTPHAGEVAAILPLPLSTLNDPARQEPHYFRMNAGLPYWKIRCPDLVIGGPEQVALDDDFTVWGLSGWFLSRLAVRLGWTDTPHVGETPKDD